MSLWRQRPRSVSFQTHPVPEMVAYTLLELGGLLPMGGTHRGIFTSRATYPRMSPLVPSNGDIHRPHSMGRVV